MKGPRALRDVERSTIVRVSVVLAGVVLLVAGAVEDGRVDGSDLRIIGAVTLLAGLGTLALARLARPTHAAYELGRQDGYTDGYRDGRSVARPVVVPLPGTSPEPNEPSARGRCSS